MRRMQGDGITLAVQDEGGGPPVVLPHGFPDSSHLWRKQELVSRNDWKLFREFTRGDGDVERYISDLSRPGALTAGLNWYRANAHPSQELAARSPLPAVEAPTLAIWSTHDNYLTEER